MRRGTLFTTLAVVVLVGSTAAAQGYQVLADDIRSGDPMRLADAARVLASMPHEERLKGAPVLAPAVIELFKHSHVGIRATGLRMIAMFRGGSYIWTPVVALCLDPSVHVRASALDTLGTLCGDSEKEQKRILPHLLIGLSDPGWLVRQEAATQAAELSISIEILVPTLAKALGEEDKTLARKDPKLVTETRRALEKAGEKAAPAVTALTKALEDKDAGVRAGAAGAAGALGAIGKAAKGAEKQLADALKDKDSAVRAAAARALAAIGAASPRTGKALGKLLRDDSVEAALAGAKALRDLPQLSAAEITALLGGLRHDSAAVRAAAATARSAAKKALGLIRAE